MESQITCSLSVCSTTYSGCQQSKQKSFTIVAFWGIWGWWLGCSLHKETILQKVFIYHDIIMKLLMTVPLPSHKIAIISHPSVASFTKEVNSWLAKCPLKTKGCLTPLVNTLRPRQNGCHFPDDIFKCILLNENVCNFALNFTEVCSSGSN